jgi:general secretion pathway protein K
MRSLTPLGAKNSAEVMIRSDDGIALIAVLWILTLLSIVAAALSLEMRSNTRLARNMAENAAARAAADAGIQRAILDLVTSPGAPKDTGKFRADGRVYAWRFADKIVQISVHDERGKIDLNQAPEALLAALFGSVGLATRKAQSLADAIADFRDADNLPRLSGAEEADYRAAGLAWGPKNAPFQVMEELQQVIGMSPELYTKVAPYLTIYSIGMINPALAGERLTRVLRPAGLNSQILTYSPGLAFSIHAETRGNSGAVFVREAVVQLDPEKTVPVRILAWRQGVPTNARNAEGM